MWPFFVNRTFTSSDSMSLVAAKRYCEGHSALLSVQRRWWRACLSMHYGCFGTASIRSLLSFVRSSSLFKSHTLPYQTLFTSIITPTSQLLLYSKATRTAQTNRWRDERVMTEFAFFFVSVGALNGCQRQMGRYSNPIFGVIRKPQSSIIFAPL